MSNNVERRTRVEWRVVDAEGRAMCATRESRKDAEEHMRWWGWSGLMVQSRTVMTSTASWEDAE